MIAKVEVYPEAMRNALLLIAPSSDKFKDVKNMSDEELLEAVVSHLKGWGIMSVVGYELLDDCK